jgi:hypothetical protein
VFASHQVGAAFAATAAGMVRDELGTYALAWYVAGALSIGAAVLSLLLLRRRAAVPPPAVGPAGGPAAGPATEPAAAGAVAATG